MKRPFIGLKELNADRGLLGLLGALRISPGLYEARLWLTDAQKR